MRKTKIINSSIVILMLSLVLCLVSVGTSAEMHENMLYKHSFFNNKHFERSSDTITYNISSSFKALTPTTSSFAGIDTNNIILFSTSNKRFLMHSIVSPSQSLTGKTEISTDTPIESSIGDISSIMGMFKYTASNVDIVFLALVVNSNKIAVHQMVSSTYTIFKVDTLTLTLPIGSSIEKLYGGPTLADGAQSSIWAVGSKGLIRKFTFDGSVWSAELDYDIDSTETVTAFSLNAVGTESGKIYEDSSGIFQYASQPKVDTKINHITSDGAVGDVGLIIKKFGSVWTAFTVGTDNYTYSNFIPVTEGSGVELLSDSWSFSKPTLVDSLTTFTILPVEVAAYVNNIPYEYQATKIETITVTLFDIDGNYKLPTITCAEKNLTGDLLSMHPDTLCTYGFEELNDTVLSIILDFNTVKLVVKTRKAAYNPVTYKYYWTYQTYTKTASWTRGDLVRVELGSQTLQIRNGETSTAVISNIKDIEKRSITFCRNSNQITFNLYENRVCLISLFTASGRVIIQKQFLGSEKQVSLQIPPTNGILFVSYQFTNGTRQNSKIVSINR